MTDAGYTALKLRIERGVAWVTIDHPPINLFDLVLIQEMDRVGRAILGQPEVAVGIIPGGGGTQRLPRLMGRGRALEVILGCDDFPAELAERYGYLNRALPPDELGPFVERLAHRIASFPASAIALAKAAVQAAEPPTLPGLLEEAHCFNQTLATPEAQARMAAFMAGGGQTLAVELAGIGADAPGAERRTP